MAPTRAPVAGWWKLNRTHRAGRQVRERKQWTINCQIGILKKRWRINHDVTEWNRLESGYNNNLPEEMDLLALD